MEQMSLTISFAEEELWELMKRKHMDAISFAEMNALYKKVLRSIRPIAYYQQKCNTDVVAVITLGKPLDELLETYSKQGNLYDAYVIESIAMEMLSKTYGKLNQLLLRKTGLWARSYQFPGAELPIEDMQEIFERLRPIPVTYNQAYQMQPQKSVAFRVVFTDKQDESFGNTCETCNNKNCTQRKK